MGSFLKWLVGIAASLIIARFLIDLMLSVMTILSVPRERRA